MLEQGTLGGHSSHFFINEMIPSSRETLTGPQGVQENLVKPGDCRTADVVTIPRDCDQQRSSPEEEGHGCKCPADLNRAQEGTELE